MLVTVQRDSGESAHTCLRHLGAKNVIQGVNILSEDVPEHVL